MTMIERVARALSETHLDFYKEPLGMNATRDDIDRLARAALEAMREPTYEMQHAGFEQVVTFKRGDRDYHSGQVVIESDIAPDKGAATVFRAMINKAIEGE